jgi:hypothetical protein
MWLGTEDSKESTGPSLVSTSVGEILLRMADVFPATKAFPIGDMLMQATLSPQAAADLLFYLTHLMSTCNASDVIIRDGGQMQGLSTTEVSMHDMVLEQQRRSNNDMTTYTSKAKPRKSGAKGNTKQR